MRGPAGERAWDLDGAWSDSGTAAAPFEQTEPAHRREHRARAAINRGAVAKDRSSRGANRLEVNLAVQVQLPTDNTSDNSDEWECCKQRAEVEHDTQWVELLMP